MAVPPTARIEAYRRSPKPDCDEIRDFLGELIETLKKNTHTLREGSAFRELRI